MSIVYHTVVHCDQCQRELHERYIEVALQYHPDYKVPRFSALEEPPPNRHFCSTTCLQRYYDQWNPSPSLKST